MTKHIQRPGESLQPEEATAYCQAFADASYDWEAWILTDGTYKYISPACARISGYQPKEFMTRPDLLFDIVHPDDRDNLLRHHTSHLDCRDHDDSPAEIEFRILTRDGAIRWIRHQCQPFFSPEGEWLGRRSTNRDITRIKQAEEALRKSEKQLHDACGIARLGYWQYDKPPDRLTFSDTLYIFAGLYGNTFTSGGKDMLRLVHPEDRRLAILIFTGAKLLAPRDSHEIRLIQQKGAPPVIRIIHEDIYDDNGAIVGRRGSFQDVTGHKHVQAQLSMLDKIFDTTVEGIVITDTNGKIEKINPAAQRILGYTPAEVIGKNSRIFKSDRHDLHFYADLWASLKKKGIWQGEIWDRRKNGELCPLQMTITSLFDSHRQANRFIGVFHDMTEMRTQEKKIHFQTYHDALTGLPNRHLFLDRLKIALRHCKKDRKLAVLMVDIDDFKQVNDSLGHTIGDLLLKQASTRIRECVREHDTVARQGGDDFILLLEDISDIAVATQTMERLTESFQTPFSVNEKQFFLTVSAGIAIAPDDGTEGDTLVSNADLAMYRAKEKGKNTFSLFTRDLNEKLHRRLELSNRLRHGLENDEFVVYYQPKVDTRQEKIVGVEALVRWEPEPGTLIPPYEFIPLAEASGLIVPLGEQILRTSCRQAVIWHKQGFSVSVAVNLSPRQFAEQTFLATVHNALLDSGLPPSLLELEITETLMMENEALAIGLLWKLRNMGIRISVDDFGTGYSSLAYLKQLPIDILKIDRSFIKDLPGNPDDVILTATIINMADCLGLEVVAEGVETTEQLQFMDEHGCSLIQGYLFSPPLPADQITELLDKPGRWFREQMAAGRSLGAPYEKGTPCEKRTSWPGRSFPETLSKSIRPPGI